MAFEADCRVSTVLEALRVASTTSRVPSRRGPGQRHADCGFPHRSDLVAQASRLHVRPGRPHHPASRWALRRDRQ